MPQPIPTDALFLSTHAASSFGRGVRLAREADHGRLHRVARGSYLDSDIWRSKTTVERYRARISALAVRRRANAVISHQSAAAFYGLPSFAPWPVQVHLIVGRGSAARSTTDVRVHRIDVAEHDVVEHDGLLITGFERTLVDIAGTIDVKSAVGMIDRALAVDRFQRTPPMTSKPALREALERSLPLRGSVRAASVIDFATHLSGSLAESVSRVNIALAGFPCPQLQRTFVVEGVEYDTDFYWDAVDGIGECDGKEKYFLPAMARGRSPQQVFWGEKQREDRLRSQVQAFARWDYSVGTNLQRLTTRLLDFGLRPNRPRALTW